MNLKQKLKFEWDKKTIAVFCDNPEHRGYLTKEEFEEKKCAYQTHPFIFCKYLRIEYFEKW